MLDGLFKILFCLQTIMLDGMQFGIEERQDEPTLSLAADWQVLGPFQIGTREATWGADPLEKLGGFRSLFYEEDQNFYSSLGIDGLVKWKKQPIGDVMQGPDFIEIQSRLNFENSEWDALRSFYGWSAFQYQAWARLFFEVPGTSWQRVSIYTDHILEFWIDDELFFGGDFYAYRRAPLIIPISPGSHRLDIRLIRDVRAMGAVGDPFIDFNIRIENSKEDVKFDLSSILLPENLQGVGLASNLGSLPIRNTGEQAVKIEEIESINGAFDVSSLDEDQMTLSPGQSRPFAFRLVQKDPNVACFKFRFSFRLGESATRRSQVLQAMITTRKIDEPHRYTFVHNSGIVSYAILRAPKELIRGKNMRTTSLPILLNLHGAGLEADSDMVRHMLDPVSNIFAWIVSPSGVTPWSGDDWHVWGLADIEAAMAALPKWMDSVSWAGPGLNSRRIYVTGHSNGGQGTWHILSHHPDRVIAAAPVSGYSSIQNYVPYQFWREMEPHIWMIMQSSLASYRHELLIDNFASIPIFQQHGRNDDNVPVFHSRRLSQLAAESGDPSQYAELMGKGHWFEGIMTTKALQPFYDSINSFADHQSCLPRQFRTVFPSSGDMGSRGGIAVDQLITPDQSGAIDVEQEVSSFCWIVKTSNIFRFHLDHHFYNGGFPKLLIVDGTKLEASSAEGTWYVRMANEWKISQSKDWKSLNQRVGAQIGTLNAFLRSRGPFLVSYSHSALIATASQISRNFYQYFAADCKIVEGVGDSLHHVGNVISISQGERTGQTRGLPSIQFKASGLVVTDFAKDRHLYPYVDGLGAIYLSPRQDEGLQLNIWGHDQTGLRQAARLLPLLTGVGQPDFIIVSDKCAWEGAAGVLGAGFFDHNWEVSKASYLR